MGDVLVRVVGGGEGELSGARVIARFQLRLAGMGGDVYVPADATAPLDARGEATLQLPAPEGLGPTWQLVLSSAGGEVLQETTIPREATGPLTLQLASAAPSELVLELRDSNGAVVPDVEVLLLGRAEGAGAFGALLAGKTDPSGLVRGALPSSRFAEVSALVRLSTNLTLSVVLQDGRLPARVLLRVPSSALNNASSALPVPVTGPIPSTAPADLVPEADAPTGPRGHRRRRSTTLRPELVWGLLAAVLLLGTILRFYDLGGPSLWNDELSSWRRTSYDSIAKVITKGTLEDVHPPGYYLLLYVVQKFGDSEWVLRFPSALAGVASLAAVFLFGRRLWGDREGILAAAIMAVLWSPIRYSQEARAYSFMILFSTLSMWMWTSLMREVDRRSRVDLTTACWYILSATVLAYLHYFGLFMVMLQCLGALAYTASRSHRQPALPAVGGVVGTVGLLYLPWVSPLWEDLTESKSWIEEPDTAGSALWGFLEFLFNYEGGLVFLVLLLWIAGAAAAVVRHTRGDKITVSARSGWGIVFVWLVLPFALSWFKSVVGTPVLSYRNLLISAPAAYLLLARAITSLPLPSRATAAVGAAVVGLSFLSFAERGYYSKPHRQEFRETVAYVVDHWDEYKKAVIIVTGNPNHFNYYFDRLEAEHDADISATSEGDLKKVDALLDEKKPRHVWRLRTSNKEIGQVEQRLMDRGYKSIDEAEFWKMSVTLYARKGKGADDEEGAAEDADAAAADDEKPGKAGKGKKADKSEADDTGAAAEAPASEEEAADAEEASEAMKKARQEAKAAREAKQATSEATEVKGSKKDPAKKKAKKEGKDAAGDKSKKAAPAEADDTG